MRLPSMSRSLVVAAALSAAALPALLPSPTYAADVAGPVTCYLADENGTIIEPRQEYTPREGAGGLPVLPSPVVAGQYTLEVSAPAMNFDPDQPDFHLRARSSTHPSVRFVSLMPTAPCTRHSPTVTTRMTRRAPPSLRSRHCPKGTRLSPIRRSEDSMRLLARLIPTILRTRALLGSTRTS